MLLMFNYLPRTFDVLPQIGHSALMEGLVLVSRLWKFQSLPCKT